ncbi:uncharacterized protein LOC144434650 [Glandiceps talaboti]
MVHLLSTGADAPQPIPTIGGTAQPQPIVRITATGTLQVQSQSNPRQAVKRKVVMGQDSKQIKVQKQVQSPQKQPQLRQQQLQQRGIQQRQLPPPPPQQQQQQLLQQPTPNRRVLPQQQHLQHPQSRLQPKQQQKQQQPQQVPDRRVITGTQSNQLSYRMVTIDGLPSSITKDRLVDMLKSVGPVENVQIIPTQHKALAIFIRAEHALTFQKRYHRHMIDLSHINVSIMPA